MNEKNIIPFPETTPLECANCGSTNVTTSIEDDAFPYGAGADEVTLHATVPVRTCGDCGFSYTDEIGEDARHEAVCRHLGVMTPAEVRNVRERLGMSRAEFARLTGLGEASLARWESGALIQNAANDNLLYMLTTEANITLLKARDRKAPVPRATDVRSAEPRSTSRFRCFKSNPEADKAASQFQLRMAAR